MSSGEEYAYQLMLTEMQALIMEGVIDGERGMLLKLDDLHLAFDRYNMHMERMVRRDYDAPGTPHCFKEDEISRERLLKRINKVIHLIARDCMSIKKIARGGNGKVFPKNI